MFQAVVNEIDDRLVLTVPPEVQRELELRPGEHLQVEVSRGESPRKRRRFEPGQLLHEHAEILSELGDNREWVNSPPVGREPR